MKIRTVIGLTGASAASLVGMAGLAAGPAGAAAAQTMPAANLTGFLGLPVPVFASPFLPLAPFPNVKVSGNCSASAAPFLSDILGLDFTSGNAVVYRGPSGGNDPYTFLPSGLNAEGVANLVVLDPQTGSSTPTGFAGPAHVWLGQGSNANGQFYAGETVSFTGTATDGSGSTISFTANPGFVGKAHSAGPSSFWGQENLSCNILPPPS